MLGLPSLHTGHWDPLMAACAETGTVVNLHVGSSGTSPSTSDDAPADTVGVLFFGYAMFAAVDWLFSRIPVRFPDLRICLSEGGIGWVPALLDRLDHMRSYSDMYGTWDGIELTPAEVLQRNFWFCAIEDPSAFALRERIGVEHILLESDYPHCDSTWPDTQEVIAREIGHLPPEDVRRITWANASELYRHPVPACGAGRPGGLLTMCAHPVRDDIDLLDGALVRPASPTTSGRGCARTRPSTTTSATTCGRSPATTTCSPSRRTRATFSSRRSPRPHGDPLPMMISMDDPEHHRRRSAREPGVHAPAGARPRGGRSGGSATRSSTGCASGASATSCGTSPRRCRCC